MTRTTIDLGQQGVHELTRKAIKKAASGSTNPASYFAVVDGVLWPVKHLVEKVLGFKTDRTTAMNKALRELKFDLRQTLPSARGKQLQRKVHPSMDETEPMKFDGEDEDGLHTGNPLNPRKR